MTWFSLIWRTDIPIVTISLVKLDPVRVSLDIISASDHLPEKNGQGSSLTSTMLEALRLALGCLIPPLMFQTYFASI